MQNVPLKNMPPIWPLKSANIKLIFGEKCSTGCAGGIRKFPRSLKTEGKKRGVNYFKIISKLFQQGIA